MSHDGRVDSAKPLFNELILHLDAPPHDGPWNMAADQAWLEQSDVPVLRVYRWDQPTVTIGYAQNLAKLAGTLPPWPVVRRWTAPREGPYAIKSTLIHQPGEGDGIRAFISHSGRGLLRSTRLHQATEELNLEALPMQQGDTVDFIVDINEGLNSDQFLWSPKVAAVPATAVAGATDAVRSETWDALKDFTGSAAQPLNGWQQLAQTLMLTNEFVFVD